jgi:hypothetical protein
MKLSLKAILLSACTLSCLSAEFIVAPNDRATLSGNNSIIEGFAAPSTVQQLYGSSQFTTPVIISGLSFRADENLGGASFSAFIPRFTVRLSTFSKPTALFSASYDANKGADELVVFDGSLSWSGSDLPGSSPNSFDLRITFSQPFVYNPASGGLLMQYQSTGSGPVSADAHFHGDPSIGLMVLNGGVTQITLVSRFDVVPVPEPVVTALLFAGVVFLGIRRHACSGGTPVMELQDFVEDSLLGF